MSDRACCGVCGFFECNCPDKTPESDYNRMAKPIVITHPCPNCTKLQAENEAAKAVVDAAVTTIKGYIDCNKKFGENCSKTCDYYVLCDALKKLEEGVAKP